MAAALYNQKIELKQTPEGVHIQVQAKSGRILNMGVWSISMEAAELLALDVLVREEKIWQQTLVSLKRP